MERIHVRQNDGGVGSRQGFKCHTCEKSVSIPVGGVKDLPQNLHLDAEVKVAQYQSKIVSKDKVPCDACIDDSSGPVVGFCCECLKFLCQLCCDHHKCTRDLHLHNVIPLGKEVSKELLASIKLPEPSCYLHDKEKLKFYCKTCNDLICRDCTIVAHKDHKHVELQTIASSYREEIKGLLLSAQKVVTNLNVAVDNNITTTKGVETSAKKATQTIRQTFDNLHKALDDRMNELLRELHTTTVARITALGLHRENCDVLKQDIGHYSDFSSHIVQTYTDHALMALKQLPSIELQATLNKAGSIPLLPCQHRELAVILKIHHLVKALSDLGHVIGYLPSPAKSTWVPKSFAIMNMLYQVKVETKDSEGQTYDHGGMQVLAEIKVGLYQTVAGKVEDHMDGTYTITFISQMSGPHQLLITMDGEHIRNSPYDLKVRASKPDYRTISGPKQLNTNITSPLCMAIHNSGDIFIGSESNCIYVFKQAGVQKAVIGSAGDAGGQFNKPSGLAIKGDVLYVADCNNHRIQVLSVSGEFVHMFGDFNCPSAVVVNSNDRLIVGDHGNCRIQVMNLDGTCFLSVDATSIGLQNISGLALDRQGGRFVRSYFMHLNPAAIIKIDDEGFALIGLDGNNTLYIFDPLGNHYHSESTPGSNMRGICPDPFDRGSVYVVLGFQAAQAIGQWGPAPHCGPRGSPGSGILLKYEVGR